MLPHEPAVSDFGKMLTAQNVAKIVGVCVKTLWKWEAAGRMPRAIRITRRTVLWKEEDILLWRSVNMDMDAFNVAQSASAAA